MPAKTCQYGNCLENVGADGVTVSLRTKTSDDEQRAIYCCASHAVASLMRLAADREAGPPDNPCHCGKFDSCKHLSNCRAWHARKADIPPVPWRWRTT
jgi:hypothetical protein